MYKADIITLLSNTVAKKFQSLITVSLQEHIHHGDYSSNIALLIASKTKKTPREIAEGVIKKIPSVPYIEKVEIAGPGFINFFLSHEALKKTLSKVIQQADSFGKSAGGNGKRVLVEYSSPNIAKSFSVGHLRSTIIGQSLYNLYQFSGWDCVGDNHLGDWGTQFGMITAAIEEQNLDISNMTVAELEKLYVDFNKRIEAHPQLRDRAREAFARLEHGEEIARKIWKQAVHVSLNEFDKIYDRLNVKIDNAYGESEYEYIMPDVIVEAKKKAVARESQGAWIVEFPHLPPAMLLKSNGTTTYFTRDLATVKFRLSNPRMKADLYIYEVGAEQALHFCQVFATVEMLGWAKKEQFVHVAHGLMALPEGKMSTRKGRTVKLEDLLSKSEAQSKALATLYRAHVPATRVGTVGVDHKDLSKVGIGAIKYNELKRSPKANYTFKWEEALNMDGDSGPYLQYTCVRARSVLKNYNYPTKLPQYEPNSEELSLMRSIGHFDEVVEGAATAFAPHFLCMFLFELAQHYNAFYNKYRILQAETPDARDFRLLLTKATEQALHNGLKILGIEVPEKM